MPYKNKKDQTACSKRYYLANKGTHRDLYWKYKDRNHDYKRNLLLASKCMDCGVNDIRVLEFDHVRGVKEYEISKLVNNGGSLLRLQNEINKCDIVCANCHRIRTYSRLKPGRRTSK